MTENHLIRMAIRIQRQLSRPVQSSLEWDKSAKEVQRWTELVQKQFALANTAAQRGWHTAALEKRRQALADLRLLESASEQLRHKNVLVIPTGPTLRPIVEELRQLKDEFESFEIDLKQGLVGAVTEPIELEGIHLGPFSIELHVNRLGDRLDSDCFRVIALEPNPASSNSETVHPHVQDDHLCAGDATVPISIALKEGRIADAFILIRSVLRSYNEDSPYISLENWHGRNCEDCGYTTDSDSMYYCEHCEHDVCEDCYSSCDACDQGCCCSCLETDPVSHNRCCSNCRDCCSACNRTVESDSFDSETELCPQCLEEQKLTQEQENPDGLVQSSTDDLTSAATTSIPTTFEAPTPAAA